MFCSFNGFDGFGSNLASAQANKSLGRPCSVPFPKAMKKLAATLAVAAPEAPAEQRNLKVHKVSEMSNEDVEKCIARPRVDFQSILQTVPCLTLYGLITA